MSRVEPVADKTSTAAADAQVSCSVLVVDDQSSIRAISADVLSSCGYRVSVAASATEALAIARSCRVDVLVTDLGLPGIPGDELADMLLAEFPDLRVVYMSGGDSTAEGGGALEPHAVAFLAKPFPLQALADAVARVLTGRAESA